MKDSELLNSLINFLIGSQDGVRKTLRKWQASLNDGLGVYLAAMGLLGLSMFFAYGAWKRAQPDREAMQAFGELLETSQEPMRMDERPTLAGAVVMAVSNWNICKLPNRSTDAIADEIYRLFLARYLGNAVNIGDFKLLAATEEGLTALKSSPPPTQGVEFQEAELLTQTRGVGSALEIPRQRSTIRIPSVTAAITRDNPKRLSTSKFLSIESLYPLVGFHPQPGTHAVSSTSLPDTTSTTKEPSTTTPPGDTSTAAKVDESRLPDFKAFYFIALDGSVAVTPPIGRPIAASRSYSHTSYVSAVLERKSSICPGSTYRYHSRPYIDIADNGLVVTLCYPVESPCTDCPQNKKDAKPPISNAVSKSTPDNEHANAELVEGVFCIDMGLPRWEIFDSLSRLKLLQSRPVRVTDTGGSQTIEACGTNNYPCPEPYKPLPTQERERAEEVVDTWVKRQTKESVTGSSELGSVRFGNQAYYVAALWRDGRTGTVRELAVLNLPDRSLGWRFAIQITGLAISSIAAVSLIGWSRRGQEARRQVSLVRGLPMGVMRLDEQGNLVGANDRAEEILKRRLPPLLLGDQHFVRITSDLDNIFRILVDPQLVGIWRDDHYEWEPYSYVDRQRAKGLASEYYVKIFIGDSEKEQWIRVLGSPIVSVDQQIHTFGLFEPATRSRALELDMSLEEHLKNSTRRPT